MLKTTRKGFYRYIGQNRQAKESIPSLVNEKGELPMTDMEKAEVLNEVLFCFLLWSSLAARILSFLTSLKLASLGLKVGTGGVNLPLL